MYKIEFVRFEGERIPGVKRPFNVLLSQTKESINDVYEIVGNIIGSKSESKKITNSIMDKKATLHVGGDVFGLRVQELN